MTLSYNYGQVRVDLDAGTPSAVNLGGTATTPFDGYSATVSGSFLDLGTQTLTAGTHQLTFTVTGTDSASTGYELGLVDFSLSPTNRQEADALSWNSTVSGQPAQQCLNQASWSEPLPALLQPRVAGRQLHGDVQRADRVGLRAWRQPGHRQGLRDRAVRARPRQSVCDTPGRRRRISTPTRPTIGTDYLFLGAVHLTAGPHVLQVTVTGKNASSSSYNGGINFIEAAPITGAKESSFTAAMNNQGIAYDGGTGAMSSNFDLTNTATGNNLSQQALASAGLITLGSAGSTGGPWTGNSFSLNGAQFTMPSPRVNSSGTVIADNVIPDGQTIPLPAVYASGVALLATSTCLASPEATVAIAYGSNSSGGTVTPGNPIHPARDRLF